MPDSSREGDETGGYQPTPIDVLGTLSVGFTPLVLAELYVKNPGLGDEMVALVGGAIAMVVWVRNQKSAKQQRGSQDA